MRSHIQAWDCCWRRARQAATGGLQVAEAPHCVPEGLHALPQQALICITCGCQIDSSWCAWSAWPCRPSRRSDEVIWACARVAAVGVDVGLVDDHQVGQFHHALLDGLQVVAGVGQLQQHEHVGHAGTAVSLWPTPTVSTITTS
jgi:hypothetical protein